MRQIETGSLETYRLSTTKLKMLCVETHFITFIVVNSIKLSTENSHQKQLASSVKALTDDFYYYDFPTPIHDDARVSHNSGSCCIGWEIHSAEYTVQTVFCRLLLQHLIIITITITVAWFQKISVLSPWKVCIPPPLRKFQFNSILFFKNFCFSHFPSPLNFH